MSKRTSSERKDRRSVRRVLTTGASLLVLSQVVTSSGVGGCATPFNPSSLVDSVRVFAVEIDKPFAKPGDDITFTMQYVDGRPQDGSFTPLQFLWIGGCFNPPGGQYYGCYEPLGQLLASLEEGQPPPEGLIAGGPGVDTFAMKLPEDLLSSLPPSDAEVRVGVAYVFFMVCAGTLGPVEQDGETSAGAFPVGCFDENGNQLGPESFVPGYTQVYAFEDGRDNPNPPVAGLTVDGSLVAEDDRSEVKRCDISSEERAKSGCAAADEFEDCEAIEFDIAVGEDVADEDPEATSQEGGDLREVVWVNYFASGGTFDGDIKLVSEASDGLQDERQVEWVPPAEPGSYHIWAVVRDNRGGSSTVSHWVDVE